jgi:hypothetical protein
MIRVPYNFPKFSIFSLQNPAIDIPPRQLTQNIPNCVSWLEQDRTQQHVYTLGFAIAVPNTQ